MQIWGFALQDRRRSQYELLERQIRMMWAGVHLYTSCWDSFGLCIDSFQFICFNSSLTNALDAFPPNTWALFFFCHTYTPPLPPLQSSGVLASRPDPGSGGKVTKSSVDQPGRERQQSPLGSGYDCRIWIDSSRLFLLFVSGFETTGKNVWAGKFSHFLNFRVRSEVAAWRP